MVEMCRISDSRLWKCPNCGGDAPVVSHFSITHLKRKKDEVEDKARDVVESIPTYLETADWIINYLISHPSVIKGLRSLFNKYALEAEKGALFATRKYSGVIITIQKNQRKDGGR